MTEEDRKGIARECRKSIMSALRDVDDMDILRRIYISVLDTKGNYCDIATGRETGHEVLVCGTGTEATGKDESAKSGADCHSVNLTFPENRREGEI